MAATRHLRTPEYTPAMAEGKKDLLRQIPRVKLWLVLMLTLAFAAVLLVAAHLTHSLTLRIEAYHALYNVLTLCGCLLTMKVSSGPQSLHNTFGWARLEVLSMITTLLFFTALCFSVSIESVQTALHVGHQDAMHHPLPVMALGAVGLALNALVFFLIGGYTHHQGCFLEMRDSGSVWVGRQVTQEAVQAGRRTLSSTSLAGSNRRQRARQLCKEVVRDTCGLVVMEVCAALVYWDDGGTVAKYIDPALAVASAALLVWLSHPYGKECCHILLQTIPGHIDVENFQKRVMKEFPEIVNVHHLHIWTFTPDKVVATAHVVFASPRIYLATKAALRQFFLDEGITQVTIQPECLTAQPGTVVDPSACLLRCKHEHCREKECCLSCSPHPLLTSVTSSGGTRHRATAGDDAGPSSSSDACECTMENETPDTGCGSGYGEATGTQSNVRRAEVTTETPTPGTSNSVSGDSGESEALLTQETRGQSKVAFVPLNRTGDETKEVKRPSPAEDVSADSPREEDCAGRDRSQRITTEESTAEESTARTSLLHYNA